MNDIDVKIILYSRLASLRERLLFVKRLNFLINQTHIQPANLFLLLPIYIQTCFGLISFSLSYFLHPLVFILRRLRFSKKKLFWHNLFGRVPVPLLRCLLPRLMRGLKS